MEMTLSTEAFADGFFGQGGDPKTRDGASGAGFLHHPALDELALLAGIPAVDDAVGLLHQLFDDVELFGDGGTIDELDAETGRNHGQAAQRPRFPSNWAAGVYYYTLSFKDTSITKKMVIQK